jgi:hypothetical protein
MQFCALLRRISYRIDTCKGGWETPGDRMSIDLHMVEMPGDGLAPLLSGHEVMTLPEGMEVDARHKSISCHIHASF